MQVVAQIAAMQRLARKWQHAGLRIAFVPTMGFLHPGHVSLILRARRAVGVGGKVVVSIYVNPTQFGPKEDFTRYPRDLKGDLQMCREAGADTVFTPDDQAMYPGKGEGLYSTFVVEEKLTQSMEGASRPSHFRGVTTVVAKLFHCVLPDVAVFGQKDFQQAAVIRRMTADLNFPVKIIVAPTLREPDGLAMSSRNKYLAGDQRRQATVLWRSLQAARAAVQGGSPVKAVRLLEQLKKLIATEPEVRLDYLEFFNPNSLEPVSQVVPGTQAALAVFVGSTRLIDNMRL